jgi:hypothetical protein
MRLLTFLMATLVALPLTAATRYSIAAENTGFFTQPQFNAIVLAEGLQRRIDIVHPETPFAYDVLLSLLSDDGGATFIALNTELKTWFRKESAPLLGRPRIFAKSPIERRTVRDVSVTTSEEPSDPIAGFHVRKYVVKSSFSVRQGRGAARIDALFGTTAIVWTTDAIDAALAVRVVDLTTGLPEVDAQLAPALAKIPGFPLKTTLTATRAYRGGPPQTFTIAATISDIRTIDAPPHAFEKPKGYVEQTPIIGAPAR